MAAAGSRQFIPGARAQQPYLNRFTQFFFTELNRGFSSPWVFFSSGVFFFYFTWRVTERYIEDCHKVGSRTCASPTHRIPMAESHNLLWGFQGHNTPLDKAILEERMPDTSRYSACGDSAAREEELRRPILIHSEPSELSTRPSPRNPTGAVDLVCLELSEYDPQLHDDVYYRSLHYVAREKGDSASSEGESGTLETTKPTTTANNPEQERLSSLSFAHNDHLNFMPGGDGGVIHGLTKCKGVTTLNNCVPLGKHLETEVSRKLLLSLAPVHVLRDVSKVLLPVRFTNVKEVPVETLVIGLHSSEMPRWLSNTFPNFNVNVIEADGTLVRICHRFFGFRESNNLSLRIGNPIDYLRSLAANLVVDNSGGSGKVRKRYDLVLIDAIDGAGQLSTQFGHLEALNNLRNCMSRNGCVAITLPNKNSYFLYNMVQNWRMAFAGRPVVLIHCYTAPYTILMTFQDDAGRGKANIGSIANVQEFQDLLRAHLRHYGQDRVQFDFTNEIHEDNFKVLIPGERYERAAFLPHGHPELVQPVGGGEKSPLEGWNAWFRRATGKFITPGQLADMRVNDILNR
ncbi:unnamed protein product [Phytomonas sp. Hart1]|nr:unnamed protein product [Phytomonas sp. Hart1]|eukprot:CCW71682.1 unnamed protein product [Phytomonas sp. isolate Hart1]